MKVTGGRDGTLRGALRALKSSGSYPLDPKGDPPGQTPLILTASQVPAQPGRAISAPSLTLGARGCDGSVG